MVIRALQAIVASLLLLPAMGASDAHAGAMSAFLQPRERVKSAIAASLGCSWRPYLEASEQCGDELVVLNRGVDGLIESIELTCPVAPKSKATDKCHRQAVWIATAFLPSWSGRTLWMTKLFHDPPLKGRWIRTSVGKATVLAQTVGPADLDANDIVIGITSGDPQSWDLPR